MLKQDVLDCVHSKVRHYAVHQTKNVCFHINPHLYETEDLDGAINELQYVPDFDETRRLESEVYGENYGLKYPRFTIPNMKEYKFWPFVAGNEWKRCSSLRITPGSLLTSLIDTYRDMENQGKILRYTTDVYENVVTHKPKGCLKKAVRSSLSLESTMFTDSAEMMDQHLEMTKISFTYYGVSISHLKEILKYAGLDDVTDDEIAFQNPGFTSINSLSNKRLKDLTKENPLKLAPSDVDLEQDSEEDIRDVFNTDAGRRKSVKMWKFTQGKIQWIRHQANQSFENNILHPIHKRIILEKNRERKALLRRRIEKMQQNIEKTNDEPGQAYRTWWLQQSEDPLMMTKPLLTSSQLSFFGNGWILKSNPSSANSNASHKPVKKKVKKQSKNKKQAVAPTKNTEDKSIKKTPLIVNNFAAVDRWKCECDVCTGNLLNNKDSEATCDSSKQADELTSTYHDDHHDFDSEEDEHEHINTDNINGGVKHDDEDKMAEKEAVNKKAAKPKKGKAVHIAVHDKKKTAGKKKKSKILKTEKTKQNPNDIWWETVSKYTTPKWKSIEDPGTSEAVNTKKSSKKSKKHPLTKKLNLSYSFEKLRLRKPHNKNNGGSGDSTDAKNTKSPSQKCDDSSKDISDSKVTTDISSDEFNINALMAHNTIYEYKGNQIKQYTKIKLPALDSLQAQAKLDEENHTTDEESKTRETLPRILHEIKFQKSTSRSTTPSKYSEALSDSCRTRINSDKTSLTSIKNEKLRDDFYFLHCVPENFQEMCFVALSEYVIRFEAVVTSIGYQRVESLTVNRTPLCSYCEREKLKKTKTAILSSLDSL